MWKTPGPTGWPVRGLPSCHTCRSGLHSGVGCCAAHLLASIASLGFLAHAPSVEPAVEGPLRASLPPP